MKCRTSASVKNISINKTLFNSGNIYCVNGAKNKAMMYSVVNLPPFYIRDQPNIQNTN